MSTGLNWSEIKREIEHAQWEEDEGLLGEGKVRRVFIGTVMSLFPSGKYYTPWANSNLELCPACHGTGETVGNSRRNKKWRNAICRIANLARKRGLTGSKYASGPLNGHYYKYALRRVYEAGVCGYCDGMGSREALMDELYREELEEEASNHGLSIESGEGDPCDLFAVEIDE